MSSFNEEKQIMSQAIESILNQETSEPFELILIIDNPQNKELIDYVEKKYAGFSQVKIVKNPVNMGLAQSLNIAIDVSVGEYICRMDADDISLPNRLQRQLDYLRHNELDLIGGRMEVISHDGSPLYEASRLPLTADAVWKASRWNNCLMHPTWFGKRSVFLQHYRSMPFSEDYDFQLRSMISGFKLGNVDEVVLKYRLSKDSISRSNPYEQYLYQIYISKQFRKGDVAEIDSARKSVEKRYNNVKAKKYAQSNKCWNSGLSLLSNKQYLRAVFYVLKAALFSQNFANKIFRLMIVAYYSLKQ